ncbi:hypothetical protein N8506_02810 [Synechococcus sp. AH-601-N23]|nr:hypothetical protein [Synechococcus sp. AH-601-N23]
MADWLKLLFGIYLYLLAICVSKLSMLFSLQKLFAFYFARAKNDLKLFEDE